MENPTALNTAVPARQLKSLMWRWWIIPLPLFFVNLTAQVDKIGISVVMSNKQFLQDMNLVGKPGFTGLLMSGFLLSYACFHFFWAYWIKKFGPRASGILGVTIWALTFLLSAIAQTATQLILARVLLGIGESVVYPMCNAFVANWFPMRERARATSIWMTGMQFGGAVCGALIVGLIALGTWRTVFVGLCLINVLVPLPLLIFLVRDRARKSRLVRAAEVEYIESGSLDKTEEVPKAAAKGGWVNSYRFWMVIICWGLHNIYWWGWSTWMPTYFQTVHHYSFKSAGYIYSLAFFFVAIVILVMGYFSDKVMRRAPFSAVAWTLGGILLFVGGVLVADPYWAVVVLVISGCCATPAFAMSYALIQSIVKETSMGTAVAMGGAIAQFMGMVSPALMGLLIGTAGFHLVVACLGMALVIPGAAFFFLTKQGY